MSVPAALPIALPLLKKPVARPVDPDWKCQRSGDCCRSVENVVMTVEERVALEAYAEKHLPIRLLVRMVFVPVRDNFVSMQAKPCPLLDYVEGKPTCLVHPVRPYNCRRFGCMRPDTRTEPLQMAPLAPILKYGDIGCVNLRERILQSRVARRAFELMQRKAQKWALKHGWDNRDAAITRR